MSSGPALDKPRIYQILVKGYMDDRWSQWFDGLDMSHPEDDKTQLRGCVADQTALHGLLDKIRDLGLPLLQVQRLK